MAAADASVQEGERAPKAARAATPASPGPQFPCCTRTKVQMLTPGELGVLQGQQVRRGKAVAEVVGAEVQAVRRVRQGQAVAEVVGAEVEA
jgi:hypothetical protein